MFAEVSAGRALGFARVAARQIEPVFRQRIERASPLCRFVEWLDLGPSLGDAVIVRCSEGDFQRRIDGRTRNAVEGDLRHTIRNDLESPAPIPDDELAVLDDLVDMVAHGIRVAGRL
ncbi:hypothetical protein D9M72_506410 [compost metagenome]